MRGGPSRPPLDLPAASVEELKGLSLVTGHVHCERLLSSLLLVIAFSSVSDSAWSQNLSLGAKVGISNSTALFEDEQSGDTISDRRGFQIGGVVEYELNSVLGLQLELTLLQKGWTEPGTGGERKLTYLDLPLLLSINAPWRTSPQLLVGPSLSYELGCSVTGVPDAGEVSCSDPRVAWERDKFLVGIGLGLGLRQRVGHGRLGVQFLGNVGLTDMNREALPRGYIRLVSVTASVVYDISLGRS